MNRIVETPESIVVNGQTQFGHFRRPFTNLNLSEADIPDIPPWAVNFRLKEWVHIGVVHPDVYVGFVINDSKYLGLSFAYAFDRKTGELIEYEKISPLCVGVKVAADDWNDRSRFMMPGHRVECLAQLDSGRMEFSLDIASPPLSGKPGISGGFNFFEDLDEYTPLVVSQPVGENRTMYSHKAVRPVEGTIKVGSKTYHFKRDRDFGLLDIHKAFYPYNTWWKWACFGGYDESGRLIGMNLTRNIIKGDQMVNNENGIWVDNKLSLLGQAEFEFDEKNLISPWKIRTLDGRAELEFKPEGDRTGSLNVGILMSDYHQPFGTFSGFAVDDDGERHEIKEYYGVTEYHLTRW